MAAFQIVASKKLVQQQYLASVSKKHEQLKFKLMSLSRGKSVYSAVRLKKKRSTKVI